ncbi:MAG: hypothetical protein AAGA15_10080 [Pseudomonadota bacterium]
MSEAAARERMSAQERPPWVPEMEPALVPVQIAPLGRLPPARSQMSAADHKSPDGTV